MTTYQCDTCRKMKPIDRSLLKVGDKVNFCVQKSLSGGSIRFSTKEGSILEIEGDSILIKTRTGVLVRGRDGVSPVNAPSALTYAFSGTCGCTPEEKNDGAIMMVAI